jgi:hypothetical protein
MSRCRLFVEMDPTSSHIDLTILRQGYREEAIDAESEDIRDFFSRIAYGGFAQDCHGQKSASHLSYSWMKDSITVYKCHLDSITIPLSFSNHRDIQACAKLRSPLDGIWCSIY